MIFSLLTWIFKGSRYSNLFVKFNNARGQDPIAPFAALKAVVSLQDRDPFVCISLRCLRLQKQRKYFHIIPARNSLTCFKGRENLG